jgi:two-component system sensor histidine kinase YesM
LVKIFFDFCRRSFNPLSLQGKMFIICMVISCGIMLPAARIITQSAVHTITDNAYNYIFENIRYADSNLSLLLDDAAAISLAVASNQDVVLYGLEDASPEASHEAFLVQKNVEAYLGGMIVNKNHIRTAALIGTDGKSFRSGGSLIRRRIIREPWFRQALENTGAQILYHASGERRVLVCRRVVENRRVRGVALVEMDYQVLSRVYAAEPLAQSRIMVFDEKGLVVFNNHPTETAQTLEESELWPVMQDYDPARRYWEAGGERVLIALHRSSANGLTTLGCISYASLMSEAWHINSLMVSIVLISIAAAALAAWIFSRTICRNIYRLQESMLRIQEGRMEIRSRITSRDEIGVMSEIFDNMMDRIEVLLEEIRKTEEQKRRAEQTVLEAQIQPHFIYNTINSIGHAAHLRGEKDIEDIAFATVQLLRGVLGVRESFIPIWQEYDYIEQYLIIQRFKMRREFRVDWDVEESLWSYPIPKLIIQPLVENALLHGILHRDNGKISVQIFINPPKPVFSPDMPVPPGGPGRKLVIKITDNGKGMSREERERLLAVSPPAAPETGPGGEADRGMQFRRVGFANVRERLALIYGGDCGVEIVSFPEAFTSVELNLPYREEGLCSAS